MVIVMLDNGWKRKFVRMTREDFSRLCELDFDSEIEQVPEFKDLETYTVEDVLNYAE
jgi:hypothetical protein